MTYKEWPATVPVKFYGVTVKPKDNVIQTEFASGRTTKILRNTRFIFDIECKLTLTMEQRNSFWSWFIDDIGGCTGVFRCDALKRTADSSPYFRFTEAPEESTGQTYKTLSMSIEEIY